MASETSRLNSQLQNFAQFLQDNSINIDPLTKTPAKIVLSLSSQLKALRNFEKKQENYIDAPTSGESSPCQSDSEKESRILMPSLEEVSELLTDELCLDVEDSFEKLKDISGRNLTLVFENYPPDMRKRFYKYLQEVRSHDFSPERVLKVNELRSICFRGNDSLVAEFYVKKSEHLYDCMKLLCATIKSQLKRLKVYRVIEDRRKRRQWVGVIIRNLPPKVTQKELINLCQREVTGQIALGTMIEIKERRCCVIKCDFIEDAELLCKKLPTYSQKDPETNIKYFIKVHLHPESCLTHRSTERSLFGDIVQIKEKKSSDKTTNDTNKIRINELKQIFMESKKAPNSDKSKVNENSKTREPPAEKEEQPSLNETGTFLGRLISKPPIPKDKSEKMNVENGEPKGMLSRIIKNYSSENAPAELDTQKQEEKATKDQTETPRAPSDMMEKKNQEEEKRIEPKEESNPHKNLDNNLVLDANEMKMSCEDAAPQAEKRETDDLKRYKNRNDRSSSPHIRRSSSRSRDKRRIRQNYGKWDNPNHRKHYQPHYHDELDKKRRHKERREHKVNRSPSRHSKSKSRSRSKSRKNKTFHSRKNKNDSDFYKGSPKRSNSSNKKKFNSKTKSRSRTASKSRSSSSRRDNFKDSRDKKNSSKTTIFAYSNKNRNSQSRENRSPSSPRRNKKGHNSPTTSHDRSKRKNSPKQYSRESRERTHKYQDYHRNQHYRRDHRDIRTHNDYKSSNRRNDYNQRNEDRDYDDRRKKRHQDNDRPRHKNRDNSRSRNSKSRDRHSSRSSRGSRERRRLSPSERNARHSSSESRKRSRQNASSDFRSSSKVVANETSNNY